MHPSRFVFAAILLAPAPTFADSFAEDLRLIAGLQVGYTTFEFKSKLDQTLTFPTTNVTLAATLNRWQLSLNGGFTLIDADVSEEEDTGDASRDDLDLTLAYQINDRWSVFAGYKDGSTDIDFKAREPNALGIIARQSEAYEQRGPYLGASYTVRFERAGALSFSAAYADLRARNRFLPNTDEPEDGEPLEFDDLAGRVTGDTTGLSYALTWTIPLAGSMLFQTRLRLNDYQQDIRFGGQSFDVDETLTSLHVGLAYVF